MITKEVVEKIQKDWGSGVVTIGTLKDDRTECENIQTLLLKRFMPLVQGLFYLSQLNVLLNNFV